MYIKPYENKLKRIINFINNRKEYRTLGSIVMQTMVKSGIKISESNYNTYLPITIELLNEIYREKKVIILKYPHFYFRSSYYYDMLSNRRFVMKTIKKKIMENMKSHLLSPLLIIVLINVFRDTGKDFYSYIINNFDHNFSIRKAIFESPYTINELRDEEILSLYNFVKQYARRILKSILENRI